jgi:hypothetical protein
MLQPVDDGLRLYHTAGNGSFDATLSWVIVVDASKEVVSAPSDLEMAEPVLPSQADIQMAFETVLGTPTGPQPLLLTLGEMPAHDADTEACLQAIANDAEMRGLHILEDNSNRAVLKGRGNKNTDPNAAVNLFLHKAKSKGSKHFSKVVKAVKAFLIARGFSNFVMRIHLNWVTARSRFSFEHGLHADAWKCALLEQEKKTARVVAVVGLKYTQEQWDAFRT